MNIVITPIEKYTHKSSSLVIAIDASKKNPAISSLEPSIQKAIDVFKKSQSMDCIKAHVLRVAIDNDLVNVVICSIGDKPWNNYNMNKWVTEVSNTLSSLNTKKVFLDIDGLAQLTKQTKNTDKLVYDVTSSLLHNSYKFNQYKSKSPKQESITIGLLTKEKPSEYKNIISKVNAISNGKNLARNLANMPPNECNVEYLHSTAKELAKDKSLTLKVVDDKAMEKLGMGAFLAVSRGSSQEGKLLILEYKGAKASEPYHALVGKGLTFDTGGISLKPAGGMEEMKYDMCGAASVLGSCKAIVALKPKVNILFVIAAAENMPSGCAARPGDIVKTHAGLTVEILNTDAEGRLVLCDALSYVNTKYKLDSIVDIATLTGACVVALGHHASALYSNNDKLSKSIQKSSEDSLDKVWPMPLWQEYQDQLSSNVADLPNISGGRDAGSITAACYLSRFVKQTPWAHLDIAGTGWQSGKNKQATGQPTSLLTHYLLNK